MHIPRVHKNKLFVVMIFEQGIGLALGVQSILHEYRRTAETQACLRAMLAPAPG
jgi:hypothetical protein